MKKSTLQHQKITDIVGDNYVFASVLYYFGIRFYDYSEHTLSEVCQKNGLKPEYVIKKLEESVAYDTDIKPEVFNYPIDLLLEYLRHAHFIFIKHKLPFIASLIEGIKDFPASHKEILEDLKMVFPLFVEDFIHHIYQEEDTLFHHIEVMQKAVKGSYKPSELYYQLEKHSMQRFAMEHDAHDDEMEGIRKITQNYDDKDVSHIAIKVLYDELKRLEKILQIHAGIENEILFPKALMLEKEVKQLLAEKSKWN